MHLTFENGDGLALIELSAETKAKLWQKGLGLAFDRTPSIRREGSDYIVYWPGVTLQAVQRIFEDMVTVGKRRVAEREATGVLTTQDPGVRVDFLPVVQPYLVRRVAPFVVGAFVGGLVFGYLVR